MGYTEEEINKYLNILHNYKDNREGSNKGCSPICKGCPNTKNWVIVSGFKICDECGTVNSHVLGQFDINYLDRLHYRKKEYLS